MTDGMNIRLMIADDHAVFRSGLRAFLEHEKDFEIVGEAGDGRTLLDALKNVAPRPSSNAPSGSVSGTAPSLAPDVLILDIHMPGPPVADVIAEALQIQPSLRIVILTMHEEDWYLRAVFKAGAHAFVLKRSTADELVGAIRDVLNNTVHIDPALSTTLVSSCLSPAARKSGGPLLTRREEEVVKLLAIGHTNEEIAGILGISKRTVETHRENVHQKLGVKTRAKLVSYAMEQGLIQPG